MELRCGKRLRKESKINDAAAKKNNESAIWKV